MPKSTNVLELLVFYNLAKCISYLRFTFQKKIKKMVAKNFQKKI